MSCFYRLKIPFHCSQAVESTEVTCIRRFRITNTSSRGRLSFLMIPTTRISVLPISSHQPKGKRLNKGPLNISKFGETKPITQFMNWNGLVGIRYLPTATCLWGTLLSPRTATRWIHSQGKQAFFIWPFVQFHMSSSRYE